MAFADVDDANLHLPDDKIEVDDARFAPLELDAERIVRGLLAGHFPATLLASWDVPANTPGLIRSIVGRLVAAFYYRERYSEDSLTDPQYAQQKYNEAMLFLQNIIDGTMVLEGVTVPEVGIGHFASTDYYPNDSAPGPYFSLSQEL